MLRASSASDVKGKRNARTGIRVRNARVRKGQFRLTYRQIILIAVLLFLFMGSGISYVWSNFEGTQIGYDLSRLRQREFELKELNRKLRIELATLKSPQYLEERARGLGLKEAGTDQTVILP